MSNPFEQPTAPPPSSNLESPWRFRLEYKSGKVPEGFAPSATPEQAKSGMSYYDKDLPEGQRMVKLGKFTAIILSSLSGVKGATKEGESLVNYYSNLVRNTQEDELQVWRSGVDRPLYSGLYKSFKADLPQGVNYAQVLIAYIPEIQETVAMYLTVGLQQQIKSAIAAATNTKANKINLFSLNDLSSQFWAFQFSGEFEKRDKEGNEWKCGEMYFMPIIKAVVMNQRAETQGWFDKLGAIQDNISAYLDAAKARMQQRHESQPAHPASPAQPRTDQYSTEPVRTNVQASPAVQTGFDPFPSAPPVAAQEDDLPF